MTDMMILVILFFYISVSVTMIFSTCLLLSRRKTFEAFSCVVPPPCKQKTESKYSSYACSSGGTPNTLAGYC